MVFGDTNEGPRPNGPDVVPRLILEMQAAKDGYTRGKFIELLGEMGDPSVVPLLIAELGHPSGRFAIAPSLLSNSLVETQ